MIIGQLAHSQALREFGLKPRPRVGWKNSIGFCDHLQELSIDGAKCSAQGTRTANNLKCGLSDP